MRKNKSQTKHRRNQATAGFVSIRIDEYLKIHATHNPKEDISALSIRLQAMLKRKESGETCSCGNQIWVVGAAQVGAMCFTCITGEANPSGDYEVVATK